MGEEGGIIFAESALDEFLRVGLSHGRRMVTISIQRTEGGRSFSLSLLLEPRRFLSSTIVLRQAGGKVKILLGWDVYCALQGWEIAFVGDLPDLRGFRFINRREIERLVDECERGKNHKNGVGS